MSDIYYTNGNVCDVCGREIPEGENLCSRCLKNFLEEDENDDGCSRNDGC